MEGEREGEGEMIDLLLVVYDQRKEGRGEKTGKGPEDNVLGEGLKQFIFFLSFISLFFFCTLRKKKKKQWKMRYFFSFNISSHPCLAFFMFLYVGMINFVAPSGVVRGGWGVSGKEEELL